MTKLVFASACVFCLLVMAFPTALFAQKVEWDLNNHTLFARKDTVVWDSVHHKYLLFTNGGFPDVPSFIGLMFKQLNAKGYENDYMNDCWGTSGKALRQFQKDNDLPIGRITSDFLSRLDIEIIHGVFIDDSWANPQLQKALRQFQRDNGLREDFLDDKTLKALGIAE